jgi:glycosyltransferase involved in cell wall biosynthesis
MGRRHFDVINTHFVVPTGPVGYLLSARWRIPNVLTVHGGDLYDPSKRSSPHRHFWLRAAIRFLLRKADVVVGQSANTLEHLSRYFEPGIAARHIPLGIERVAPAPVRVTRAELGLPDSGFVLVTVGRLVARKGIDQLIRLLREMDANVLLSIIGEGPLREELESLATSLGVAQRVRFEGFVTEARKQELLRAADLYVSTSQHEGFGLVFLEAMAAGLPVVCYDFGGQTDFLEDGATGALVPLNDLTRFAERCRHFMRTPAAHAAAARENLRRVEDYFIDRCATRYEALFAEVIARRSNAGTAADWVSR